jgi:DNA-binding transcriptional LysR family regulator
MMGFMQVSAQSTAGQPPWELDSRHLSALVLIARTRSISKAAEELGFGQSAVSQQLAALERIVGRRLVDRGTGPRPVTLTAAGEVLLCHATWILERLHVARNEMELLESGAAGTVRIGTFQSAGARLLPQVLAVFRRQWPNIAVSIYSEVSDGELTGLVRTGSLDLSFVESSMMRDGLAGVELVRDEYVALVPPHHRLATRAGVSLHDFAGEDMIDGASGEACTTRAERAFRDRDVYTNVVFRTDDNPTRQRLVDAGLGCAVLPGLTVEPGLPQGAVMVPLQEDLHRTISLAWSSDRTPSFAMTQFIAAAQQVMSPARAQ